MIQKIVFVHAKPRKIKILNARLRGGDGCLCVPLTFHHAIIGATPGQPGAPLIPPGFSHQLQRARAFQATIRHLCLFAG